MVGMEPLKDITYDRWADPTLVRVVDGYTSTGERIWRAITPDDVVDGRRGFSIDEDTGLIYVEPVPWAVRGSGVRA